MKFYHIDCLRKKAHEKGNSFMCPTCGDYDNFRTQMLRAGVFINDHAPQLEQYISEEEEEEEENDEPPRTKSRRIHKVWLPEKTFETHAEAMIAINEEKFWSKHFENKSKMYLKVTYRCNRVIFRGTQCDAGVQLN